MCREELGNPVLNETAVGAKIFARSVGELHPEVQFQQPTGQRRRGEDFEIRHRHLDRFDPERGQSPDRGVGRQLTQEDAGNRLPDHLVAFLVEVRSVRLSCDPQHLDLAEVVTPGHVGFTTVHPLE